MKVFLHYEESEDESLHKTLKITLPKSWKNGPTSKLLNQFVESYNASDLGSKSPLDASDLHLSIRRIDTSKDETIITPIPSDAITIEVIEDREDVYICHGPSETLEEIETKKREEKERRKAELENTVVCANYGCNNRFPKGGPYPNCVYHAKPPVFHETAKFWSCCPDKKAYDWETFQQIKGCQSGKCVEKKEDDADNEKQFLGGCDLREAAGKSQKLKSIDDFNSAQANGSDAAPILERLRSVYAEMGIEYELFDQVVEGIKKKYRNEGEESDILAATTKDLGEELKKGMKSIAASQLRLPSK